MISPIRSQPEKTPVLADCFRRNQRFALSGLALLLAVSFSACQSDHVSIDEKNPDAPRFAYRLDELALLQMTADDIMTLERAKNYGQIYDKYASADLQQSLSRRRFLIQANCVETQLGAMLEYDRNQLAFNRESRPVPGSRQPIVVDVLNRRVQRVMSGLTEQFIFVREGLNFHLKALNWQSKDKSFMQCVADSPQTEQDTPPADFEKSPVGTPQPTQSGKPDDAATTTTVPPENAVKDNSATKKTVKKPASAAASSTQNPVKASETPQSSASGDQSKATPMTSTPSEASPALRKLIPETQANAQTSPLTAGNSNADAPSRKKATKHTRKKSHSAAPIPGTVNDDDAPSLRPPVPGAPN